MQWLLKNWFKLGLLIVIPLSAIIFTTGGGNTVNTKAEELIKPTAPKTLNRAEFTANLNPNLLPAVPGQYPTNAVCTLKLSASTKFSDQKLTLESGVDANPINLTFIDLNTDKPSMIGNMGDKTPLTKINNGNVIYLIESTTFSNMNVFTFFADKNIMMLSKQYDLGGTPFGMIMIGDCQIGIN